MHGPWRRLANVIKRIIIFQVLQIVELGWILNTIEIDELLLRKTALNSRIVCVSGNFRTAPEYKFPIPVDDTVAIVKWVISIAFLTKGSFVN